MPFSVIYVFKTLLFLFKRCPIRLGADRFTPWQLRRGGATTPGKNTSDNFFFAITCFKESVIRLLFAVVESRI